MSLAQPPPWLGHLEGFNLPSPPQCCREKWNSLGCPGPRLCRSGPGASRLIRAQCRMCSRGSPTSVHWGCSQRTGKRRSKKRRKENRRRKKEEKKGKKEKKKEKSWSCSGKSEVRAEAFRQPGLECLTHTVTKCKYELKLAPKAAGIQREAPRSPAPSPRRGGPSLAATGPRLGGPGTVICRSVLCGDSAQRCPHLLGFFTSLKLDQERSWVGTAPPDLG